MNSYLASWLIIIAAVAATAIAGYLLNHYALHRAVAVRRAVK